MGRWPTHALAAWAGRSTCHPVSFRGLAQIVARSQKIRGIRGRFVQVRLRVRHNGSLPATTTNPLAGEETL